nr:class I SAM-dependent methyltransferase [Candidatus Woesearchaeota archaeon]
MKRKCNLCNSTMNIVFEKDMYNIGKAKFNLVKCLNCKLIFVDPLPNSTQRKEMYSKDYFETNKLSGTREKGYMEDQEYYEQDFKNILRIVKKYKRNGRFLDIGCAAGYFLNLARKYGYQVHGVEISKFASEFARKKFKLDVFNGELENAKFKDNFFDIVVAANVLEHVEDPNKFLLEIKRILKPNGILVIDIPTYVNSPYYKIVKLISGMFKKDKDVAKMFKVNQEKMPYHLYEFSPRNLKMMLKKLGFKLLETKADVPYPEVIFSKKGFKYRLIQLHFIILNMLARTLNIKFNHMVAYFKK